MLSRQLYFIVYTNDYGEMRLEIATDEHGNTHYFRSKAEADDWAFANIHNADYVIYPW